MYTSIKAHFENGQVIFDEPIHAEHGTELIVTLLPSSDGKKLEENKSLKELLLNAPTWNDQEYNDFLDKRNWISETRLNK